VKRNVIATGILALATIGASAQNINGAGATFPYPIYSKWFNEYGQQHPNVKINYQSIGSGGGIRQVSEGTAEAVEAGDHQRIALAQDREHLLQLGAAIAFRAARLLLEHDTDASTSQGFTLHLEVLVGGRHSGVADQLARPWRRIRRLVLPRLRCHCLRPQKCPNRIWLKRYVPSAAKSTLIGRLLASHPHVLSGFTLIRRRRASFEAEVGAAFRVTVSFNRPTTGRRFWFEANQEAAMSKCDRAIGRYGGKWHSCATGIATAFSHHPSRTP